MPGLRRGGRSSAECRGGMTERRTPGNGSAEAGRRRGDGKADPSASVLVEVREAGGEGEGLRGLQGEPLLGFPRSRGMLSG